VSAGIAAAPIRLSLGYGLALHEQTWWIYRYSRQGIHLPNLPLQLAAPSLFRLPVRPRNAARPVHT
jgi:hypothetical protein